MKLSLKLLAGYFLIVGLAAYFVLRIFVAEIKPSVRTTIEEDMVDMANVLAEFAAPALVAQIASNPGKDPGSLQDSAFARALNEFTKREVTAKILKHNKDKLDLRVYVTDDKGIVLFDSSGQDLGKDYSAWRDVYLTLRGQYGARSTREIPGDESTAIYHVAAPIRHDKKIIGVLTVAKPVSSISPIIDDAERNILGKGAWLVLGSLAIGIWVSFRLQRSVGRLVGFAESLAKGTPAIRPRSSTQELELLANAIEKLRGQLDGKLYVERYVQALTHELKSPLTALQAHSELLQDSSAVERDGDAYRSLRHIDEQTQRMRALVDQMLILSRLEGGHRPVLEKVDWASLLQSLLSLKEEAAGRLALALEGDFGQMPALVDAETALLSLACSSLIQNAIDFSSPGGAILCRLESLDKTWRFSVRDFGPGLSDLARTRLFEPYFSTPRPGRAGRSSGLGLTLVRQIVQAHGGMLSVDSAQPGCLATIQLPMARQQ